MEDTPAESKTGETSFHHGLHPTDMQGQAKIQHPSKWADNIYSRKFGETIDEGDDNHGGDDLSQLHQRRSCEFATKILFSPKRMSPRILMIKIVMMTIVMITIVLMTMTMMIRSQRRL